MCIVNTFIDVFGGASGFSENGASERTEICQAAVKRFGTYVCCASVHWCLIPYFHIS